MMILVLLLALASFCFAQSPTSMTSANGATYTNPILDDIGADPWV